MGLCYRDLGEYESAVEYLREAIEGWLTAEDADAQKTGADEVIEIAV